MNKKIAMICRYDNSGLGTLSWEFARHLKPHKILLVENERHVTFPERYDGFNVQKVKRLITPQQRDWFFEDTDVFFTIETPYDWGLIKEARKKNIKNVLYTMYEMTPEKIPLHFDLYLCPSKLDYDVMPEPKQYLPVPVATDRLRWRERGEARIFIHSASHGGIDGRKGTQLFLDAIPHVKAQDIQFHVYTWEGKFSTQDPRVLIQRKNFKNYWQMWREGDVLVYPQDYNGICLPIIEAMSSGLGVITTDIYPFNEYMPQELLFKPESFYDSRAASALMPVVAAKIDPIEIAKKIDEFANQDISRFSQYGREWAKLNSWDTLLEKYVSLFENL